MNGIYDRTTEDSLVELTKAGFRVDLTVRGFGDEARFRIKISEGLARHGGVGLEIVAEGDGADGAAALRGAVATADTYMHAVPRAEKEAPAPVPQLAELLDATDVRRERNQPVAELADKRAADLLAEEAF